MPPFIFTFYSFKGGVGRTMAMLNVGYCLASWGRNVLMLDMDLEAPGLSEFIAKEDLEREPKTNDIVDVVAWARRRAAAEDWDSGEVILNTRPAWNETVVNLMDAKSVPDVLTPQLGEAGRLDVIAAHPERDYLNRLTALRLGALADDAETLDRVSNLVRACVKSYRFPIEVPEYWGPDAPREVAYDYILVDSRTGFTEIGGLCVGPLADRLVVLTSLNEQNIGGTRSFLDTIGIELVDPVKQRWDDADPEPGRDVPHRLGPKPTLIVTSPVPYGHITDTRARRERVEERLGRPAAQLSYHPQMALSESVFVRDYRDEYLAGEYRRLAEAVTAAVMDSPQQLTGLFQKHWNQERDGLSAIRYLLRLTAQASGLAEPLLRQFANVSAPEDVTVLLRFAEHEPSLAEPLLRQFANSLRPESDADFRRLAEVYTLLASSNAGDHAEILVNHSFWLIRWAQKTRDEALQSLRLKAALERCTAVLGLPDTPATLKASVLINRGTAKALMHEYHEALTVFGGVLDMPDVPPAQKATALLSRGVAQALEGNSRQAIADYSAVLAMADARGDQKAEALVNRAIARREEGHYEGAAADYTAALNMPDTPAEQRAHALLNRGVTKGRMDDAAGALADYMAVLDMQDAPTEHRGKAHGNIGWAAYCKGEYEDAAEHAHRGLELASGQHWIRANLGLTLLQLGRTDEGAREYGQAIRGIPDMKELHRAVTKDLREAIKGEPDLPGADKVLEMVERRRRELEAAQET